PLACVYRRVRRFPVAVGGTEVQPQFLDDGPQFQIRQGDDTVRLGYPVTTPAGKVEGRWPYRLRTRTEEVKTYRPAVGIGEVEYPRSPTGTYTRTSSRPVRHVGNAVVVVARAVRRAPVCHRGR